MRGSLSRVLVVLGILVALAVPTVQSASGAPTPPPTYIVLLASGVDPVQAAARLRVTPTLVYRDALNGYAAPLSKTQVNKVSADAATLSVQADTTLASVPTDIEELPPVGVLPFRIERIGGLDSPTAKIDGIDERVDVDVAILDDGIDADHPDLNVAGVVNCVNPSHSDVAGDEYQDNKDLHLNRGYHGTAVGGVVGALDNTGGYVGVAPGARLWGIQLANAAGGFTGSRVLCGLNWVAAHADVIEVVNMSFGASTHKTGECVEPGRTGQRKGQRDLLHEAICAVDRAGLTMVASAGNDSSGEPQYPAAYPEVISVSAMGDRDGLPGGLDTDFKCGSFLIPGQDDGFAWFSNYGPEVDISAPGVCIASTTVGGTYFGYMHGTSFSAPHVTGAAALYLAKHPDASPAEVRAALLERAEPGPIPDDPDNYPEGIVNVAGL